MTKIILGGGLSGLAAAHYISRLIPDQKILLLEHSSRVGGWIRSERINQDVIFETAVRTIRPGGLAGINTLNLVEELSLNSEIKPIPSSSPAAKNRFIYSNGQLHPLPKTALGFLTTQKPFTKPLVVQLLQDLITKPKIVKDEPIYEFVKRRFGGEVADYLIDPLICGICAGNSKEISVNFLMKTLFRYEQEHGSVLKGAIKHLVSHPKMKETPTQGLLATQSKVEKWSVYTFKNGMETLSKALEKSLQNTSNVNIHLNSKCKEVQFNNNIVNVHLNNGQQYDTDHIISSIPAKQLAQLIQKQHPKLADKLLKIKFVTVGVVNLLFKGNLISKPGFGFLVPPKEKLPILGVIYDSCSQGYKNETVLTVMMGGFWFSELFGDCPSEECLLQVAKDNIRTILKISEEPVHCKVSILRDCIPQYVVGHEENLQKIVDYIKMHKLPLSLCGASYYGVGVNDVIISAKNAVFGLDSLRGKN